MRVKDGDVCRRCKMWNCCGWSNVHPETATVDTEFAVNPPCHNYCRPSVIKASSISFDAVCLLFKAIAAREYNDARPRNAKGKRVVLTKPQKGASA